MLLYDFGSEIVFHSNRQYNCDNDHIDVNDTSIRGSLTVKLLNNDDVVDDDNDDDSDNIVDGDDDNDDYNNYHNDDVTVKKYSREATTRCEGRRTLGAGFGLQPTAASVYQQPTHLSDCQRGGPTLPFHSGLVPLPEKGCFMGLFGCLSVRLFMNCLMSQLLLVLVLVVVVLLLLRLHLWLISHA